MLVVCLRRESSALLAYQGCRERRALLSNAPEVQPLLFRLFLFLLPLAPLLRNTPSTAGNSMTDSERPSPEPLLKKEAPPAVLGGENSGNALEASNALNYRIWGIPAVLSTGIPGKALRAFPGSFRNFSGNFFRKCQPYWGYGPSTSSSSYVPSCDSLLFSQFCFVMVCVCARVPFPSCQRHRFSAGH